MGGRRRRQIRRRGGNRWRGVMERSLPMGPMNDGPNSTMGQLMELLILRSVRRVSITNPFENKKGTGVPGETNLETCCS